MPFGLNQINNPTPSKVNLIVRVLTVVIASFLAWMATTDLVNAYWQHLLTGILGLVMSLINGVAPLFGVTVTQSNIPTETVTAVDTDKIKTDK